MGFWLEVWAIAMTYVFTYFANRMDVGSTLTFAGGAVMAILSMVGFALCIIGMLQGKSRGRRRGLALPGFIIGIVYTVFFLLVLVTVLT
jgi:hypothetical protein